MIYFSIAVGCDATQALELAMALAGKLCTSLSSRCEEIEIARQMMSS